MTTTTPIVTDPAVARALAEAEYRITRSPDTGRWLCCSLGADGGYHYRTDRRTLVAAEAWVAERVADFAARILSGDVDGTLVFVGAGGKPYTG